VHAYITPPDQYGFSWHYDAEEVFILQTTGRKEYALRKNTVNPWPIEETLPADMHYEREIMPMMKCTLSAGDWLYIPSGWWHKASALAGEPAISLALGVMPRTGVHIFDLLRREVLDSLLWRQRLPVMNAAGSEAALRALLEQLSADAARLLKSEAFYRRVSSEDNSTEPQ
jgi:ribosomal protein L16 Arg81 hydroxylase